MSALPQFANSPDQPRVPPPCAPAPTPTWLSGQSTKQPKPSATMAPFKFVQWQARSQQVSPYLPPRAWEKAFVMEYHTILGAIDEQIRLLEHPKPPERAGEFQYRQWEGRDRAVGRDLVLMELERVYVFEDRAEVAEFIQRNRLRELLLEARGPLNAAFGERAVKKLTLVEDDEGFVTLFCFVLVPGGLDEARWALNSFDERWWLAQSHEAGGKLNFDFELI